MKSIKKLLVFISLSFFTGSVFVSEGIAVIDYNAIFLGTDLARERIDDLRDSPDYKELTDEAQSKDNERIKLAEKLNKDESTLSDSEKEEMLNKETNFDIELKNNDYYNLKHPEFILHSFDLITHPKTTANQIVEVAKRLELENHLKFYNEDYPAPIEEEKT